MRTKTNLSTKIVKLIALTVGILVIAAFSYFLIDYFKHKNLVQTVEFEDLNSSQNGLAAPQIVTIDQLYAYSADLKELPVVIRGYYGGSANDKCLNLKADADQILIYDDTGCVKYSGEVSYAFKESENLQKNDLQSIGRKVVVVAKVMVDNGVYLIKP